MEWLRLNPDIAFQNVVAWKLVIAMACAVAIHGFLLRTGVPWLAARCPGDTVRGAFPGAAGIFGWERERYQRALLQQIPEVMALICRAVVPASR